MDDREVFVAKDHNELLHVRRDSIQDSLSDVNRQWSRPGFLADLSCSRLPSQAASVASTSSGEIPLHLPVLFKHVRRQAFGHSNLGDIDRRSPLYHAVEFANTDDLDDLDNLDDLADCDSTQIATATCPKNNNQELAQHSESVISGWAEVVKLGFQPGMASDRGFSTFEHGHHDLVLAVDFNFYGTRMATASSDHRIKVYDRKDDTWSLIDAWRGHDAEVVDIKWNGPFTGSVLGSIAEDGTCKLWEEDLLEPPHSGRRFKNISRVRSQTKVPYCSLDFKNIHTETYIALITRDGHLSVLEPQDHDILSGNWAPMMQRYICATPSRQDETGFRVAFHREKLPCWTAVEAGLDRKALSLAVAAMEKVKIFRTDHERKWYQAAELVGAQGIIRDVAWANGSMRGYDVIATASKDGAVRVYTITTPIDGKSKPYTDTSASSHSPTPSSSKTRPPITSGLAAGLTGSTAIDSKDMSRDINKDIPGRIKHSIKRCAELSAHGTSVWRVAFSQMGRYLVVV